MKDEKYISEEELDKCFEDAKLSLKYHSEMVTYGKARERIKWLITHLSYRADFKPISYIILKFNSRNGNDKFEFHPNDNGNWEEYHLLSDEAKEIEEYFKKLIAKYFDIEEISKDEWKITLKK